VINDSDVFPEREDDVISVIDRVIRQACNMWCDVTTSFDKVNFIVISNVSMLI
jgi:hypothetical protein